MIDVDGRIDGYTGAKAFYRGRVIEKLLTYNFVSNGSVALIRRECFEQVGGFDNNIQGNDDYYLYLKIADQFMLDYAEGYLVGYRWNTGSNKSASDKRQIESFNKMMNSFRTGRNHIPTSVFRRAESAFYLGRAQMHFKKQHFTQSGRSLSQAVRSDFTFLLSDSFIRVCFIAIRYSFRKLFSGHTHFGSEFEKISPDA